MHHENVKINVTTYVFLKIALNSELSCLIKFWKLFHRLNRNPLDKKAFFICLNPTRIRFNNKNYKCRPKTERFFKNKKIKKTKSHRFKNYLNVLLNNKWTTCMLVTFLFFYFNQKSKCNFELYFILITYICVCAWHEWMFRLLRFLKHFQWILFFFFRFLFKTYLS